MKTPADSLFMVFDVEACGLHGYAFVVGWVLVDGDGNELESARYCSLAPSQVTHLDDEPADADGAAWVRANVPHMEPNVRGCAGLCDAFWADWTRNKARGAMLFAECAWPVEARFLAECVDWNPAGRYWGGPYPLHDIASIRLALGLDPLATCERLPNELPVHDPLADARQSARLLVEALKRPRSRSPVRESADHDG